MSMIDFAQRRRQQWRREGVQAERERSQERQRTIDAIIADPVMSAETKLQAIAAINAISRSADDD